MVKPFSPRELVARVRAVLRRSLRAGGQSTSKNTYQTAHFTVDVDQRLAVVKPLAEAIALYDAKGSQTDDQNLTSFEKNMSEAELARKKTEGTALELTPLEFDLLCTFMSYPGRVWNRAQLIEKLWGGDFFGDERVVDAHIARLRKKVEPNSAQPTFIKTVVGVGYRFEDEAS